MSKNSFLSFYLKLKNKLAEASFPLMWSPMDDLNKFLFELMV